MPLLLYEAIVALVANGACPGTLITPTSSYEQPADSHCPHWWDAEPCCWCGTDLGDADKPIRGMSF